jgi:regulator of ribonuclease activity A
MIISTPDLCDEHGDAVRVADPVFKHYGGIRQFGGEVVTVKCFEDNSKVGEMLRAKGNGRILLVDGGASPRRSLLGDKLVTLALENDWCGIVIYGYIRDIEEIEAMQIGVLALGSVPRKTEKRGVGQVNVALEVAGLTVNPGQFLYADATGVIVADQALV